MKIGYPCINRSIGCTANHTFKLRSYSPSRLIDTVNNNLVCLEQILNWNARKGLLFFRISSDLVPFASHPICKIKWDKIFKADFQRIGRFIMENNIRISMHPDQFVVLNSPHSDVVERSIKELDYHCRILDSMSLPSSVKVQIHVGGVYGDKESAMQRFCQTYKALSSRIKHRLVIENDDRLYSLADCLKISSILNIPILFDVFHHKCLNNGESIREGLNQAAKTWKKADGALMVDYSSQKEWARTGTHAESIKPADFKRFLHDAQGVPCDVMLEIKDKEASALKVKRMISAFE